MKRTDTPHGELLCDLSDALDRIDDTGYGAMHGDLLRCCRDALATSAIEPPKERLARITIRNPDLIKRVVIEVCGRREVLEAGESFDLALAEKDKANA